MYPVELGQELRDVATSRFLSPTPPRSESPDRSGIGSVSELLALRG
jgi:hypothetical protein